MQLPGHDPASGSAPGAAGAAAPATPPGPERRALVLGLGESGLAMARWLAREGWSVEVRDSRETPPKLADLRRELPQARFSGGALGHEPGGAALVALSPGIAPRDPSVAPLLAAAKHAGVEVVGEIELFARALAALALERGYAPRVLGVTGTNGKTTTVRMLGAMLARAGAQVRVAGNVSPSALDALRESLDAESLPQFWVLELSSFQLATTVSLRCHAAALLNVTEDHLDWHHAMEDYLAAKLRVFAAGTHAVIPAGAPWASRLAQGPEMRSTFGPAAPAHPGEFGLVRDAAPEGAEFPWLACTQPATAPKRKRKAVAPKLASGEAGAEPPVPAPATADPEPLFLQRLMPAEALGVPGRHNAMNALAALALARAAGAPVAPCLKALQEFRGEAHRTQPVASIRGVEYIDDSKGTNVGATVAALESLAIPVGGTHAIRGIVVILGGDGKGQSFAPLARAVREHARLALLIGRDAPLLAAALSGAGAPFEQCPDLAAAVRRAAELAREGEAVLLSPACASFDAFRNYAHRAEVFRASVSGLAAGGAQ